MKDFPSTCHEGLYNSSISSCHRSGSRYFMTSSMVPSPATASDRSSMPCRDGAGTAGTSGPDALCGKHTMKRHGNRKSHLLKNVYTELRQKKHVFRCMIEMGHDNTKNRKITWMETTCDRIVLSCPPGVKGKQNCKEGKFWLCSFMSLIKKKQGLKLGFRLI